MSNRFETATVGEIVAADFRAAEVLERFGIDFCCGGRRSLTDACRAAVADPDAVVQALEALPPARAGEDDDVVRWGLDRLIGHIVSTHHVYVRSALPRITQYLTKLVEVHGARHPELARVSAYFDQLSVDFSQHLLKEEQVLFPYVKELASGEVDARFGSPFGTIENPIRMMEREHHEGADVLRIIRELTKGYTAPADGCSTYRACLEELEQFERDLHRHVHLENNVLFPRAIEIENAALAR